MKNILKNRFFRGTLLVLSGIFLGWLFFYTPGKEKNKEAVPQQKEKEVIWTCAMHPQIREHAPGKCPICGMDLIPLDKSSEKADTLAVSMSQDALEMANVQTAKVTKQMPVAEIRLYGKIQPDERKLQSQVAQFPGRIEKLYVNFTGEAIRRGQPLALLYSPDWITAQQELLEAAKNKSAQPAIYEAAKEKLRSWKIPEFRIDAIANTGNAENDIEITANTTGVVTTRNINNGDFVSQGQVLFEVADLSHVWVLLDAYESDLPFVTPGDQVVFQVQALPGKDYSGRILFIDPVLDPVTRVAKVRVEMNNPSGELKPEMFVTGLVKARLNRYGNLPTIPRTAVLWTGARSVVYVKQPDAAEPVFRLREVVLGPLLGDHYVVEKGLTEGEEVVTSGAFMVDASAQLEGKPSMMNREDSMTRVP